LSQRDEHHARAGSYLGAMALQLDDKTAVITGAGSGIGRQTALACARRGAALAICDIDAYGLKQTAEQARGSGVEVLAEPVDVSRPEQVEALAEQVEDRLGGVDLLVNNAGIGVMASFADTELEDWRRLIEINLMGVVHGCRSFVPRMKRRGAGGHIVNVASQAGFQASPALPAYSASKFAVFGFSEALRAELRPAGIGVTAVCPGVINTAITRTSTVRGGDPEARQQRIGRLYERRNYGPEKVAERILRAVERNRAVAPIAPEAHLAYALSRWMPPLSRWSAARLAALTR